ncbi:protein-methionine-sulfoxide reductase catalytic subunit MsrP [Deefgea sp. CFH1-16]|uniref:protein-methionine-sulfoxide reductase catalytic subunit MsrP n=1 Tax=Deefgea sp. CFH1-16 TaxID=2675457 RepID=UPI0015F6E2F9|nr:protein-methionine-sulfoxide reductase catalytic subunit MsrP [Deefgea sp. CFH1-16]MBM5575744.1 protein-methionine-sulfoxide reductase catalytic subunit MsrP [Deefgea sp. CFH1-16]
MLIRQPSDILPSEITPQSVFLNRRQFMLAGASSLFLTAEAVAGLNAKPSALSIKESPNSLKQITTYNNYYEFGTDKADPALYAGQLKTKPWQIVVSGELGQSRTYSIDDLLKVAALEERIYRLRCVEGWSMVIPWVGIPLASVLKQVSPTSKAKFVAFETLNDPKQMPGQRSRVLEWPYREGLRIDEAMHPLTILAVGLYGEVLPNQNGAPVRLVVPWKYGFKSIKSVVSIRLQEQQPATSWNQSAPNEYGFYSNVNPDVAHPRWSQAKERRIGEFLKRDTLPFNGYAPQVASMYQGMDLRKFF